MDVRQGAQVRWISESSESGCNSSSGFAWTFGCVHRQISYGYENREFLMENQGFET